MYTADQYNEFSKNMEEKYPLMFNGTYGGFGVDKGWWHIIESLCASIQHHIDWKNSQYEKFAHGEPIDQVVVLQIKEKFGGLRFYCSGGNSETAAMIRMAEAWASKTCEECGDRGKSRSGGWVKTLCDEHHLARTARA